MSASPTGATATLVDTEPPRMKKAAADILPTTVNVVATEVAAMAPVDKPPVLDGVAVAVPLEEEVVVGAVVVTFATTVDDDATVVDSIEVVAIEDDDTVVLVVTASKKEGRVWA